MKLFLILFSFILAFSLNGPARGAETMSVCINQPNPHGWVTTGYHTDIHCGSALKNAKTILNTNKLPAGSTVNCCANQPNPPGWVTTGYHTDIHCGTGLNNTKTIRRAQEKKGEEKREKGDGKEEKRWRKKGGRDGQL